MKQTINSHYENIFSMVIKFINQINSFKDLVSLFNYLIILLITLNIFDFFVNLICYNMFESELYLFSCFKVVLLLIYIYFKKLNITLKLKVLLFLKEDDVSLIDYESIALILLLSLEKLSLSCILNQICFFYIIFNIIQYLQNSKNNEKYKQKVSNNTKSNNSNILYNIVSIYVMSFLSVNNNTNQLISFLIIFYCLNKYKNSKIKLNLTELENLKKSSKQKQKIDYLELLLKDSDNMIFTIKNNIYSSIGSTEVDHNLIISYLKSLKYNTSHNYNSAYPNDKSAYDILEKLEDKINPEQESMNLGIFSFNYKSDKFKTLFKSSNRVEGGKYYFKIKINLNSVEHNINTDMDYETKNNIMLTPIKRKRIKTISFSNTLLSQNSNHNALMMKISNYTLIISDITDVVNNQINIMEDKYQNIILSKLSHEIKTKIIGSSYIINELQDQVMSLNNDINIENLDCFRNCAIINLIKLQVLIDITGNSVIEISDFVKGIHNCTINRSEIEISEIVTWISSCLTSLLDISSRSNVQYEIDCPEELNNKIISIDLTKLSIILYEILKNSIEFTFKGKILVKIECIHSLNDEEMSISIIDTGDGISKNKLKKIFQDFESIDNIYSNYSPRRRQTSNTVSNFLLSQEKKSVNASINYLEENFALLGRLSIGLKLIKSYCNLMKIKFELNSEEANGTTINLKISLIENANNGALHETSKEYKRSLVNNSNFYDSKPKYSFKGFKFPLIKIKTFEQSILKTHTINKVENIESFKSFKKESKKIRCYNILKIEADCKNSDISELSNSSIDESNLYVEEELNEMQRFEDDDKRLNLKCNYSFFNKNSVNTTNLSKNNLKISYLHKKRSSQLSNTKTSEYSARNSVSRRKSIMKELTTYNKSKFEKHNINNALIDDKQSTMSPKNLRLIDQFTSSKTIKNEYKLTDINEDVNYILVVDDESLLRRSVKKIIDIILTKHKLTNYKVLKVYDGIETLCLCANNKNIKLIISDENMNYLSGSKSFEILRILMATNKISYCPLIIYTALENEGALKNIKELSGCNEIMKKISNKTQFEEIILKYLVNNKN